MRGGEGGGGGEGEEAGKKGGEGEEDKEKILLGGGGGGGGDTYEDIIYGRERDWLQAPLQAGFILHNGTHNNTDLVVV